MITIRPNNMPFIHYMRKCSTFPIMKHQQAYGTITYMLRHGKRKRKCILHLPPVKRLLRMYIMVQS